MLIGLDDTDSRTRGMCTTYLATLVAESVSGYATVEGRLLTRLNPNIEYRTRGNACLTLEVETSEPESVKRTTLELVEENAVFDDENTNPGVAFFDDSFSDVPDELAGYTLETIRDVKTRDEARKLADEYGIETHEWKNGRGVIGAVAAIGAPLAYEKIGDFTYELIAYRSRGKWDDERRVDYDSFFDADDATYPRTWDTVDRSIEGVVCVPNTDGPVLYGIRGDSLGAVWEANSYVEVAEVDYLGVFRSNQGTDAHLIDASVDEVRDNRSYRVSGTVIEEPETREGGHVFFSVGSDDPEEELRCAAFEPTKNFREVVRKLREGDEVTVYGSVKDSTLNVEKMKIRGLNRTEETNPVCDECGRKMESAGRDQGYRCRNCGTSAPSKVEKRIDREIETGWYEVPPSARRHLSKPLVRGEFENPHHSR